MCRRRPPFAEQAARCSCPYCRGRALQEEFPLARILYELAARFAPWDNKAGDPVFGEL